MLQRHQHRHQDSLTNEETTGIHAFSCFSQFSYRICMYLCVSVANQLKMKSTRKIYSWWWRLFITNCMLKSFSYLCLDSLFLSHYHRQQKQYTICAAIPQATTEKVAFHVIAPLIRYVWNTLLICVHFLCGPTFSKAYVKEWSEEFRQTMRKWCVIKEVLFWFVLIASLSA